MLNELSDDLDTPTLNRVIGKEMRGVLDEQAKYCADTVLEILNGKFAESDLPAIQEELVGQFRFLCDLIYVTAREQTLIQVDQYLEKRTPDFDTLYENVLPEEEIQTLTHQKD